ncbi:MAG TPA: alanine--glyoxylate aminotransferase family protein [Polyangiaceae bacterium]|jgi:alanine-glyoxylate transaminase/serine-glyoxylate transaminase/serine-pyruvate transaminase
METAVNPVPRILLGPGPSNVPKRVLKALARPTIGHLDPEFLKVLDRVSAQLRQVFRTQNQLTLAVSGTGSAGMEALLVNLIEPGDRVLIGRAGVFGGRMVEVAGRCGATVVTREQPWGRVFDQDEFIQAVRTENAALVCLVHAETSTGAHQPIDRIGTEVARAGGLFLVDCVTSLGGAPLEVDAWQIDAAYSGTQKCLSCPPGLAPITLSERACEKLRQRKSRVQSWYLDLSLIQNYWGTERVYHHTAPVNMLFALDEALAMVLEEGLPARFERHRIAHQALKNGLKKLGIEYLSQPGHHLPMLNAVAVPPGVDEAAVRHRLLVQYGIEIGSGLGDFRGKAWRIGLMGESATKRNVQRLLRALREILAR